MFDIAWSELLVIIVVALVVVGPKDLPRLMRKAGQWAARARAMADQFRRSFDDIARQSELDELRAEVSKLQQQQPLSDVDYALYDNMPSKPLDLDSSVADGSPLPAAAEAPATPSPVAGDTPVASPAEAPQPTTHS